MMIAIIAALGLFAWLYLLAARGGFWRAAERDDEEIVSVSWWPRVIAIIPARDEAQTIAESVGSLLAQDYPGDLSVIVVDDHSSDDTAAIAREIGARDGSDRVTVLRAPDLATGWTGKLWALEQGVRHANALPIAPEYLLFTDADIAHARDSLRMLVASAHRDGLGLSSRMAKLNAQSAGERAMIPAFVFFFQMLYPFAWVNDRRRATAAGAGGCMLVHRQTLNQAGGLAAIRGELIDDCALARLLKPLRPIRIALTDRVRSLRAYPGFADIRRMIVRTAFTELEFSPWRLAAATAAMIVVFVAPPVLALAPVGTLARVLGGAAWLLMALAYQPMLRFYRLSPAWGLALPAIAAIYVALTIESAILHWRGRGGEWKGRVRPRTAVAHSRKGMTTSFDAKRQ
ncbi:MAG TPA: glycosyltransferase [Casimicrobiaceae bacterium]|nr:glycosyltransferase [Casimicrobiaceae bacterium]